MTQCDKCNGWVHNACSGIDEQVAVTAVKKFYCRQCRERYDLVHEWNKKEDLTSSEIEMKKKHYYEVEEIIGHWLTGTGRKFIVKWKNYDEPDTLPERYLDGCLDLLQDYCIRNKLALSKIKGLLGAVPKNSAKFDPRNWKTMEQICEAIQNYRKHPTCRTTLPVVVFKTVMDCDGIYLVEHDFHCYVVTFLLDQPKYLIADGSNNVCIDMKVRDELKEVLNSPKVLEPRVYHSQTKRDHCASSAVLIALEILRMHREDGLNSFFADHDGSFKSPTWIRDRVIAKMHKYKSQTIKTYKNNIMRVKSYQTCQYCGHKFAKSDRRVMNIHKRFKCQMRKQPLKIKSKPERISDSDSD